LCEKGLGGILGDEMGLGKTIQSVALMAHMLENGQSGETKLNVF
jgi:ATP-dependent DNA helicase